MATHKETAEGLLTMARDRMPKGETPMELLLQMATAHAVLAVVEAMEKVPDPADYAHLLAVDTAETFEEEGIAADVHDMPDPE